MTSVVVRRSAWRMWMVALGGVPLIVISVDVLTQRRITDALRGLLFRPEDTQLLEPRDIVWAWALLVIGAGLTLWGLKELIAPTPVLRADLEGLKLKIRGPFRGPAVLVWDDVDDVGSASVGDEGDRLPVLWVRVMRPDVLPADPWGARWTDERTVAILAADWERSPTVVAREVTDLALHAARQQWDHARETRGG